MEASHILVRFGELSTKGKNRKTFIRKLANNIKRTLSSYTSLEYEVTYDRIYILLNGEDHKKVSEDLKKVFGIHSFSICYKVETDLEVIKEVVSDIINRSDALSFKIATKRHYKEYPMESLDINKAIAGYVFHHTNKALKVDVHHPDIEVKVELRQEYTYIYDQVIHGAGGYPVGVGAKALLMLSGGIDSPVAGYMTLKRGIEIECIHYASPPYTSDFALEKVYDLAYKLKDYGYKRIKVHVVPFTDLQLKVYEYCDESYAMTVMRRMMYRIAEGVAKNNDCLAIVNGESIGQVASQTLESINTINSVINMPVIRPVACLDKLEIIDIATKIDTYDISIRPHEDCCTIFTPKQPATKPKTYKAESFEALWDYQSQVEECIKNVETIVIDENYSKEEDIF